MAEKVIITIPIEGPTAFVYNSTSPNPYKGGDEKMDVYTSEDGTLEAWTQKGDRRQVIQVGPVAGLHRNEPKVKDAARLPVAELRQRAIRVLAGIGITDRSKYHPLEDYTDNKSIYFFRWDDFSVAAKEDEMPPFVQVVLYADGRLASFTRTMPIPAKATA